MLGVVLQAVCQSQPNLIRPDDHCPPTRQAEAAQVPHEGIASGANEHDAQSE
jgi:hypothetical protein